MTAQAEQETTVTMSRGDDLVYIYSAWPAHIRILDRDERVTRRDGRAGKPGTFTVPLAQWSPLAFKRRSGPFTDAQREARADRARRNLLERPATPTLGPVSENEPASGHSDPTPGVERVTAAVSGA